MAKIKELGIVKIVHGSGIVETDKGIRSQCKAKKGDRLIQDLETRIISVAPKKTDTIAINVEQYSNLDVEALKEKFNIKELKAIAKQEGRKGYSKLDENELANLIIFNNVNVNGTDEDETTGTDDVSGDE
jgi:Mn-dependent DtxR family transcriptional regulator